MRLGIIKPRGWSSVVGPAGFAAVAVALLVYDHVHRQVNDVVFWLSLVLVAAIFVWLVGKTASAVAREHRKGVVDQLTGLPNARKLESDLGAALATPDSWLLVLVSLDGMPAYNDRHGHAAGDQLLRGFSRSLADTAIALGGTAYCTTGAAFALLTRPQARLSSAIVTAVTAIPLEPDEENLVSASHGEVGVPEEAGDPRLALQIATQRLASHKQRQRLSVRGQVRDVLLAVLAARRRELRENARDVAYWVIAIGRKLGLDRDQLDDVVLAAELRDVGLLTVSEATLEKQLGRDQREVELMHQHPIAGEAILNAAPTLASVAPLVRAANEHVDGSGYPDGLFGQAIPLGSRIIAVCAAFSALTAGAQHPTLSVSDACDVLKRHAGTQFDGDVVDALASVANEATAISGTGDAGSVAPAVRRDQAQPPAAVGAGTRAPTATATASATLPRHF
jgi:diguanylate cyclase (GGDEF)-like protein